ncbi:uncharacterized protein LOC135706325 [Ochlerotatus camptorhynchus]|uniref:uncharacterized protein LOC135706325 n=1 Tax=Ochlerotatus camptorhynchus TaxID=644619 RepID=UPI0031DE431B
MMLAMMYQCCIIAALMITHCLVTHQSPPLPSSSSSSSSAMIAMLTESVATDADDRILDPSSESRLRNLMGLVELASADDPTAGEMEPVSNSGSRKDEAAGTEGGGRKTGLDRSSSRNALDGDDLVATGKGYPTKQRSSTTLAAGAAMSPSLSDNDNPLHTTDLEMNTNPSTQRSLRPQGSITSAAPTVPTSQTSPSPNNHQNDEDDEGAEDEHHAGTRLPPSVPAPQHQHQPQLEKVPPPSPPAQQQQRHRTINSMNLNPTTPAMVVKPVDEHRKLLKSTGPILNYVFDSHPPYYKSNYYNTRYGPHFETDNVTNITVQNGDDLFLSCRISLLQDKTVSWVRRKHGETDLQLLTVGKQTYSGDSRYTIEFQYPNNWRLKIASANKNDEGVYECQISTHPPKVIIYYLHVNAPEVLIVDEEGEPLYDKYYEVGSTIKLMCRIRHMSMLRSAVYWIHNENILNHDVQRGGISVKTNLTNIGANSTLFVAKVNKQDSGSYTCSIGPNQHYSVSVHVLNGTANPYGIYQRSCAFSALLTAVDSKFILKQLLFLMLQRLAR